MAKKLQASVGKGGRNRAEDVLVVQYLLNCVSSKQGGPTKELVLDGLCGSLTESAIVRFQSKSAGFADGRVDAGGPTFHTLLGFDPYPHQNLNLPAAGASHKKGGTSSTNSWDPWGYNNPAGKNYHKSGFEPPNKMGDPATGSYKLNSPGKGFPPETSNHPAAHKDWGKGSYKLGSAGKGFPPETSNHPAAHKDWNKGSYKLGSAGEGFFSNTSSTGGYKVEHAIKAGGQSQDRPTLPQHGGLETKRGMTVPPMKGTGRPSRSTVLIGPDDTSAGKVEGSGGIVTKF